MASKRSLSNKKSIIEMYKPFWTKDKICRFKNIIEDSMKSLDFTMYQFEEPGDLWHHIKNFSGEEKRIGSPQSYHRFVSTDRKPQKRTLTCMLYGIGKALSEREREINPVTEPNVQECKEMFDSLIEYGNIVRRYNNIPLVKHQLISKGSIESAINIILRFITTKMNIGEEAEARLFREKDEEKVNFHTLRFSIEAGKIQKSFTVLQRPTLKYPFVRFWNFYDVGGEYPRRSEGFVLPYQNYTMFIGHSQGGEAPKIIVISNTKSPHNKYSGLILSDESENDIVAARCIMYRTNIQHSTGTKTGKISLNECRDFFTSDEDLLSIRNRVDFKFEEKVYYNDRNRKEKRELTEREMVQTLGYIINNPESGPTFTTESGKHFNPADHVFYTFNSALSRK